MNCIWTWRSNCILILARAHDWFRYLWSLNLILSINQLFFHIRRHFWNHIRLDNHPPILFIKLFLIHLWCIWILLMLLLKGHIIAIRDEWWITMMMLVMNPGAPKLRGVALASSANLIFQRGSWLGFELDAWNVSNHYQVSWMCRFSLEEHRLLTCWRGIWIIWGKLHKTLVTNNWRFHSLLVII